MLGFSSIWTENFQMYHMGLEKAEEWESQFLGRLIRSPGVPKERGVWNSQGGRKDKLFFFLYIP